MGLLLQELNQLPKEKDKAGLWIGLWFKVHLSSKIKVTTRIKKMPQVDTSGELDFLSKKEKEKSQDS